MIKAQTVDYDVLMCHCKEKSLKGKGNRRDGKCHPFLDIRGRSSQYKTGGKSNLGPPPDLLAPARLGFPALNRQCLISEMIDVHTSRHSVCVPKLILFPTLKCGSLSCLEDNTNSRTEKKEAHLNFEDSKKTHHVRVRKATCPGDW